MDITTLTALHTALSFVGILLGMVVVSKSLHAHIKTIWSVSFLAVAVATTATGFLFPITVMTPALATGIMTSITLLLALAADYIFRLKSFWRWVYVGGVIVNIYFLFFVLVAQAFQKIAALNALAPTLSEPPFAVAQIVTLIIFIGLGTAIVKKIKISKAL